MYYFDLKQMRQLRQLLTQFRQTQLEEAELM
jgi:hypothetical protein